MSDYPVSRYAATKNQMNFLRINIVIFLVFLALDKVFFTVYGPVGRRNMAYYSFTKPISAGLTINVFNSGKMKRNFTYIDDIAQGIVRLINLITNSKSNDISNAKSSFQVLYIGNNNPVMLRRFIRAIEHSVGKKAIKNQLPM